MIKRFLRVPFQVLKPRTFLSLNLNLNLSSNFKPGMFHFSSVSPSSVMMKKITQIANEKGFQSVELESEMKNLLQEMNGCFTKNKIDEGLEIFRFNVEMTEKMHGKNERYLVNLSTLARIQINFQKWAEAEKTLTEILKIKEENSNKEEKKQSKQAQISQISSSDFYEIGTVKNHLGKREQAKLYFQKCEKILRSKGIEDENLLVVVFDLARINFHEKNIEKSLTYFREAYSIIQVQIEKQTRPKDQYLMMLVEITNVELFQGDPVKASAMVSKSRESLGNIIPQKIEAIEHLSDFYYVLKEYKSLESLVNESISILPKQYHARLLPGLIKTSIQLRDRVKGEEACLKLIKVIQELNLSIQTQEMIGLYRSLTNFQIGQNKVKQATESGLKSLEGYRKLNKTKPVQPDQIEYMTQIANLLFKCKMDSEAQQLNLEILELLDLEKNKHLKSAQGDKKWRGICYETLLNIYIIKQDINNSLKYALKVEEQFSKKKYEKEINVLIRSKSMIGLFYNRIKNKEKSDEYNEKYKAAVEKHSNKNDLIYAEFLEREGTLFELEEDYKSAIQKYRDAEKLYKQLGQNIPELMNHSQNIALMAQRCEQKVPKE